jgi:hypothetical protein
MEDKDLRDWISKLVHEEHELFRRKLRVPPPMPIASGCVSSKSSWTSAGIFSDSVERNEPQASIPSLRAFAMSKRLSTTTNEGELTARSWRTAYVPVTVRRA